jgi:hypothetical protein
MTAIESADLTALSNKQMQQTAGALISARRPQLICVFDRHLFQRKSNTAGVEWGPGLARLEEGRGPRVMPHPGALQSRAAGVSTGVEVGAPAKWASRNMEGASCPLHAPRTRDEARRASPALLLAGASGSRLRKNYRAASRARGRVPRHASLLIHHRAAVEQ